MSIKNFKLEQILPGLNGRTLGSTNGMDFSESPFFILPQNTIIGSNVFNPFSYGAIGDGVQTPRVVHEEFLVDLTICSKSNGDIAYNTNATAGGTSIGVGVALSNGSNWKNLYSGNIY